MDEIISQKEGTDEKSIEEGRGENVKLDEKELAK